MQLAAVVECFSSAKWSPLHDSGGEGILSTRLKSVAWKATEFSVGWWFKFGQRIRRQNTHHISCTCGTGFKK